MSVQKEKVKALVDDMRSTRVSEDVIEKFEDAIKSVKCRVHNLLKRVGRFGDVGDIVAPRSKELKGLLKANRFLAKPTMKLLGVDVNCTAKSASLTSIAGLHVSHMDLTSDYLSRLLPWLVDQWAVRSNSEGFTVREPEARPSQQGRRRSGRTPKTTQKMINLQNEWRTKAMIEVCLTFISTNLSSSCLHHWAHNYPFALTIGNRICLFG